jgi:hypothetical protein
MQMRVALAGLSTPIHSKFRQVNFSEILLDEKLNE